MSHQSIIKLPALVKISAPFHKLRGIIVEMFSTFDENRAVFGEFCPTFGKKCEIFGENCTTFLKKSATFGEKSATFGENCATFEKNSAIILENSGISFVLLTIPFSGKGILFYSSGLEISKGTIINY